MHTTWTESCLSRQQLTKENRRYLGSGGRSQENRHLGFRPAFKDCLTGAVYLSCFADGRPAPMHLLDGLPRTLCVVCAVSGRVLGVRAGVISGFCWGEAFYTREQASAAVSACTF